MKGWSTRALRASMVRFSVASAALCCMAAASPAAGADTLVYVKDGYVYVANADGSNARTVTPQSQWWAWPSESDGGTIAVAGGAEQVNPGGTTETSGSQNIYAFDQQGNALLSSPALTPGGVSSPGLPQYSQHFRISPDGTTVAYYVIGCCGASGETTFLSELKPGSEWTQYMDDFIDPEWVANSQLGQSLLGHTTDLILTHNGATFGSQTNYGFWDPAQSSHNLGWQDGPTIGDSDYEATISRGNVIALVLDDASSQPSGLPTTVKIQLETVTSGAPDYTTANGCAITLPAAQFQQPHNMLQISPSFTTDSHTLAWGQADGIYEANVSNPSDCNAINASVHLAVPGGAMPSFGAAPLSAKQQPPGPGSGPGPTTAPTTKITKFAVNQRKRSATAAFSGTGTGFQCELDKGKWHACRSPLVLKHLSRGKHVFSVRARDAAGDVDATPATKHFTIKHVAARHRRRH